MSKRLPSLKAAEVIRALKRAGFYEKRETGSHVILRKEGLPRPIPVCIRAIGHVHSSPKSSRKQG